MDFSILFISHVAVRLLASVRHKFEWHVLDKILSASQVLRWLFMEVHKKIENFTNFGWVRLPETNKNFPTFYILLICVSKQYSTQNSSLKGKAD